MTIAYCHFSHQNPPTSRQYSTLRPVPLWEGQPPIQPRSGATRRRWRGSIIHMCTCDMYFVRPQKYFPVLILGVLFTFVHTIYTVREHIGTFLFLSQILGIV
jgi:hypothetical protein